MAGHLELKHLPGNGQRGTRAFPSHFHEFMPAVKTDMIRVYKHLRRTTPRTVAGRLHAD